MINSILQVEDEEADIFLLQMVFKKAGINSPVQAVTDGQMALDYLAGAGSYADRQKHPLPCLVLLDLKLPKLSGFEVLAWIRQQAPLRGLVVVVSSSSSAPGTSSGPTSSVPTPSSKNPPAWIKPSKWPNCSKAGGSATTAMRPFTRRARRSRSRNCGRRAAPLGNLPYGESGRHQLHKPFRATIAVNRMKRLLRNVPEEQYLLPSGNWTTNPNEALNFRCLKEDSGLADVKGYRNVEVASVFEAPRALSALSLEPSATLGSE